MKTKYTMNNFFYKAFTLITTIFLLTACGSGGGSSGGGGGGGGGNSPTPNGYLLGTLPNGSSVYASSQTFQVNSGSITSGILSISGGQPNFSYTFDATPAIPALNSLSLESISILPTLAFNPAPCTLISGTATNSCNMIFSPNNAIAATYAISLVATDQAHATVTPLLNALKLTVSTESSGESGTTITIPGLLGITLGESKVSVGSSLVGTVTLSNSQNESLVQVNLAPSLPGLIQVSPTTVNLSTDNPGVSITVTPLLGITAQLLPVGVVVTSPTPGYENTNVVSQLINITTGILGGL